MTPPRTQTRGLFACFLFAGLLTGLFAGYAGAVDPDVKFDHITLRDGLSHNTVRGILQDRTGFLWFATEAGLNRWDGTRMGVFRHEPGDPCSLSDNFIWRILEDRDGFLWVATNEGGLDRFDRRTNRFHHFRSRRDDPGSLSDNNVQVLSEDPGGNIWAGTLNGGVSVLDRATGRFRRYLHREGDPRSIRSNQVIALLADRRGLIWVGTDRGLDLLDPRNGAARPVDWGELMPGAGVTASVQNLFEDSRGRVWVSTTVGMGRLDQPNGLMMRIRAIDDPRLEGRQVMSMTEEPADVFWMGGGFGLIRLGPGEETPRFFTPDPYDKFSLSPGVILAVHADRAGNIWVGSNSSGVCKYSPLKWKFPHVRYNPEPGKGLSHATVRCIFEDRRGVLWVGTLGGGLSVQAPDGTWGCLRNRPGDPSSLAWDHVSCVAEDGRGRLWVGTWGRGLDRFDPVRKNFEHFRNRPGDPSSLGGDIVQAVLVDRAGRTWVGTEEGLDRFDEAGGSFVHFRSDPRDLASLSDNRIQSRALLEAPDGALWVGTWNGLNRLDPFTGRCRRYFSDPNDPSGLSSNRVISLHLDRAGMLWIGTYGGGLCRMDPRTGRCTSFGIREGLPDDVVYAVLEDDRHEIWLSTNRGLSRFVAPQGTFRNYDEEDGLQSNQFFWGAAFRSVRGELFFGGINGFNRFFPGRIRENPVPPRIVLTGFRIFNVPVALPLDISVTPEIVLTHDQNFFTFEFAALDFVNPGKTRMEYMMEGLDTRWLSCGAERRAAYTNLEGGEYVFRVRGANSDGVWNPRGAEIRVRIVPPWWKRPWLRVSAALLVALALLVAYRQRICRIRAQQRKLEELVVQRTQELRFKHEELEKAYTVMRSANEELRGLNAKKTEFLGMAAHDLRNPLTAVLGYADMVLKMIAGNRFQPAQGMRYLEKISEACEKMNALLTSFLDIAAIETGSLTVVMHPENPVRLLHESADFHRRQAERKGIRFSSDIPDDLPDLVTDRLRFSQVLDNLLSNAVKYTPPGGEVLLRASREERFLVVSVRDNGPGLTEEDLSKMFQPYVRLSAVPTGGESSTGLGLSIVKRIVERHCGEVFVTSRPGEGSTFGFRLPLELSAEGKPPARPSNP